MIEVRNIDTLYGETQVLFDVSLRVAAGEVVSLLGANGAGKTTTLRAISGFIGLDDAKVTDGTIAYKGRSIGNLAPHRITAMGIALVPERNKVFDTLTIEENLEVSVTRKAARGRRGSQFDLAYSRNRIMIKPNEA